MVQQVRHACGSVLADATLAAAIVHDGILHFVTEPLALDAASWHRIGQALHGGRPGPPGGPGTTTPSAAAPDARDLLDHDEVVLPLVVQRRAAGVLIARRPGRSFSATEQALLRVIADRVAAAAENGRLHANLSELLAEYMSRDVASTLLADPGRSQLGGETRDVTVLFADLSGFTSFSERTEPAAVVALLNRLFAAAVPAIVENGGTVSTFIGDAIMGLFGAPQHQPEHPLLAARAALGLQAATAAIAADRPDLPRFRVGINTGLATVGNVGSPRRRHFTAIGDTVNVAARLESAAPPGGVVMGPMTHAIIRSFAEIRPMGPLAVKGRAHPVDAYELLSLRTDNEQRLGTNTLSIRLPGTGPAPVSGPASAPAGPQHEAP